MWKDPYCDRSDRPSRLCLPANGLKGARTATGGSFHSGGRVLILKLNDSVARYITRSSNQH